MNAKLKSQIIQIEEDSNKRDFLKKLGIGTLALASAPVLQAFDQKQNSRFGTSIDKVLSPQKSLMLLDKGDGFYYIKSFNMPDHATGDFSNKTILAGNQTYKITKNPKVNEKPTPLNGWLFGLATNGVVMDPTGPWYWKNGVMNPNWKFEVLSDIARPELSIDFSNAHVQPSGEYHYHGIPLALYIKILEQRKLRQERAQMTLLGFAADGFPVYAPIGHERPKDPFSPLVPIKSSYKLTHLKRDIGGVADGTFVEDYKYIEGSGNLDECNGRYGVTPEFPQGTYHYYLTHNFPFIPRFWRGTPDESFTHAEPLVIGSVPMNLRDLKL